MAKKNTKRQTRLAGGYGPKGAVQTPEAQLRRLVLACLLWEDLAYQSGASVAEAIRALIPQVSAETVAALAVEARTVQKLRHVPLLLAREMARIATHKHVVGTLLPRILLRPDDITEFLALYWQDRRQPLAKQVKVGIAQAYRRFDAYQLAKYKQTDKPVKLRDPLFLVHAKPADDAQAANWKALAAGTLATPDTWEVALSAGKDKKATWERLIAERKIGALAFLRNLRNMEAVNVSAASIQQGFDTIASEWLLPVNFMSAADAAPNWKPQLEMLMFRSLAQAPRLPGTTAIVVDVSGSMQTRVSGKSAYQRLDAAAALAVLAREMGEAVHIYATAGNDSKRTHQTERLPDLRGFALADAVRSAKDRLGGGGIFTRQMLLWLREQPYTTPDRIIVISDSQDCDLPTAGKPEPFGRRNYIVDISSHTHGINYEGIWTAEISGWSEAFLRFIAALESEPAAPTPDEGTSAVNVDV